MWEDEGETLFGRARDEKAEIRSDLQLNQWMWTRL